MWLRIAGIGFWVLTALVTLRLVCIPFGGRPSKAQVVLWILLLAVASGILFRPHENIFGGQDGGAYFNLGVRAGHDPSLCFKDDLLEQVPFKARADFLYYGPNRPYLSKYACGCVKDLKQARHGPWFQAAPAIVLSIPAWFGGPKPALFVVPFFVLLAALALRAVAASVIEHPWAGPVAFLLYVTQPLVAWHGRCVRPELIASFLLLAGGALLFHAATRQRWRRTPDLLLGATCLALAPLFHVTAWMVLVPIAFLVGAALLAGRDDFCLYPLVQYAGLALFVWQIFNVSDTYRLSRRITPYMAQPFYLALPVIAAILLLLFGVLEKRRNIWPRIALKLRWHRLFPWLLALAVLIAYIGCYLWARQSRPAISVEPDTSYLYRTDLLAVTNMLSVPTAILGLAGLVALALMRRGRPLYRWLVLLALVPASLAIGNLYDFFMTRYMLVALLPLLALGLTALVSLLSVRRMVGRVACVLAIALILVVNLHGRTHLITKTEYKGFADYLARVTRPIVESNGIMLAEYPQLAAPMELSFGVPTLALHNERDRDYQRAMRAWRGIMEKDDSHPAYFVTPFTNPPYDEYIRFHYVDATEYMGYRLLDNFWDLPNRTGPWGCRLTRYRMTLKSRESRIRTAGFPRTVTFDAGNMGVSAFGQVEEFEMTATGRVVHPHREMTLALPDAKAREAGASIWVIVLYPDAVSSARLSLQLADAHVSARAHHLRGAWWLYTAELPEGWGTAKDVVLKTSTPLLVSTVRLLQGADVTPLFDCWQSTSPDLYSAGPARTRWALPKATVRMPPLQQSDAYACVLLAGPEELAKELDLRITDRQGAEQTHHIPTGIWFWDVWSLTPSPHTNSVELCFEAKTVDGVEAPVLLESIVVFDRDSTDSPPLRKNDG